MPWIISSVGDNEIRTWAEAAPAPDFRLGAAESAPTASTSWFADAIDRYGITPADQIGILGKLPDSAVSLGKGVFGIHDGRGYQYFDAGGNSVQRNAAGEFGYFSDGALDVWTAEGYGGQQQIWNRVNGSRGDAARAAWGATPQQRLDYFVATREKSMNENPFATPAFALTLAAIGANIAGLFGAPAAAAAEVAPVAISAPAAGTSASTLSAFTTVGPDALAAFNSANSAWTSLSLTSNMAASAAAGGTLAETLAGAGALTSGLPLVEAGAASWAWPSLSDLWKGASNARSLSSSSAKPAPAANPRASANYLSGDSAMMKTAFDRPPMPGATPQNVAAPTDAAAGTLSPALLLAGLGLILYLVR